MLKAALRWKKSLAFSLALLGLTIGLSVFQITSFTVHGESMSPAFHEGDKLILWKANKPKRDNLVIFTLPPGWERYANSTTGGLVLKRVKGIEGDLFTFREKSFSVNGKAIAFAPYCNASDYTTVIPKNTVLVVADNRINSLDSLEIFCKGDVNFLVSESLIDATGRAVFQ